MRGQLANEGFNDWTHLGHRLKEHETSREHVTNMTAWYDLHSCSRIIKQLIMLLSENYKKKESIGEKFCRGLF